MAHEVRMPQMGESIAEGTVTTWLKKVGEKVNRDEPLYEISTDKVDAEIPSPVAGVLLEIKVLPGQTVPINTVVAIVGEAGEGVVAAPASANVAQPPAVAPTIPAAPVATATGAPTPAPTPAPLATPSASRSTTSQMGASADERRRVKSSPLVRNIAAEHKLDIASIPGTGLGGRVTKEDILAVVEKGPAASSSVGLLPAPDKGHGTVGATFAHEVPPSYRPRPMEGDRTEELSTMRAKIAEHMVWSRRISAHVQTLWEVDYSAAQAMRAKYKASWLKEHGVPLTYTAFITKAVVTALKAFPTLNASLDGQRIIFHQNVNLGLAVALDWGLIVPVMHNASELNLLGLAKRAADLAERARTKKLKPEEVAGGTFTISNPGVFGSTIGFPIINQPQVAIMGVGAIEKRVVVVDDMIAIRPRGFLSLSFDHRLVDGSVADQFMAKVKASLEGITDADLS